MALATRSYDSAEFLDTDEAIDEYVRAASEDGDAAAIARALGVVARARGMSQLSRETGIARTSLYKALSGEGNPELATIAKVAQPLGFRLALTVNKTTGPTPRSGRSQKAA
jgi:probable addiction module antidote protein